MTDDLAVIDAEFVAFRTVSGRKVLQLQLEIPIERTTEVLTKLGTPVGGSSLWVAVALLDKNKKDSTQASETSGSTKDRKFSDLPYSQQAALRCQDGEFVEYICGLKGIKAPGYDGEVAQYVRYLCKVQSRKELDDLTNDWPRSLWHDLERSYQVWLTDRRFKDARR